MRNYAQDARNDAKQMALQFVDEIVEQLEDKGEAVAFLEAYHGADRWHNETHVDRLYPLLQAAQLLDQLSEHKEDDCPWEGLKPWRAISDQAACTYGNAVLSAWEELIDHISFEYANRVYVGDITTRDIESNVRTWINDY